MWVVLSNASLQDLTDIGDYIAQDNPLRALDFVEMLERKALSLGDAPRAWPVLPRFAAQGIRRFVHGNYAILYQIEDNHVLIVRILHSAREMDPFFDPLP